MLTSKVVAGPGPVHHLADLETTGWTGDHEPHRGDLRVRPRVHARAVKVKWVSALEMVGRQWEMSTASPELSFYIRMNRQVVVVEHNSTAAPGTGVSKPSQLIKQGVP